MRTPAALFYPMAIAAVLAWPVSGTAQPVVHTFPGHALLPTATQLHALLAEKTFSVRFENGVQARYQYKGDYVYINVSTGAAAHGKWTTEAGRLCFEAVKGPFPSSCAEVRTSEGKIYIQRAHTGEVVTLDPA